MQFTVTDEGLTVEWDPSDPANDWFTMLSDEERAEVITTGLQNALDAAEKLENGQQS